MVNDVKTRSSTLAQPVQVVNFYDEFRAPGKLFASLREQLPQDVTSPQNPQQENSGQKFFFLSDFLLKRIQSTIYL